MRFVFSTFQAFIPLTRQSCPFDFLFGEYGLQNIQVCRADRFKESLHNRSIHSGSADNHQSGVRGSRTRSVAPVRGLLDEVQVPGAGDGFGAVAARRCGAGWAGFSQLKRRTVMMNHHAAF